MSQARSKLTNSIDQYQQTAEDLEAELVKAFHKLKKRTGKELWKPLSSLQNKHDAPKLNDVVKEVHENIERLRGFDHEKKERAPVGQSSEGHQQIREKHTASFDEFHDGNERCPIGE
jgi:hypothetical protein